MTTVWRAGMIARCLKERGRFSANRLDYPDCGVNAVVTSVSHSRGTTWLRFNNESDGWSASSFKPVYRVKALCVADVDTMLARVKSRFSKLSKEEQEAHWQRQRAGMAASFASGSALD